MQHSNETKNKIKALSDLGFSSREIAKLVLGSESKKSTINNYLKEFGRKEKESASSAAKEDNSRILFISDLHIPFHHQDSFAFLRHLKQKYKPTRVICLGDELDKHSLSYHDHDPNGYSAGHELEASLPYIKELEEIFPKMDIIESNHGSLVWRKAKTNGIPKQYIKSYNDVLEVGDGWQWYFDLTIALPNGQQCYVHHGKSSDVIKLSQQSGMNAVQGHFHERFKIDYWANSNDLYWSMQCGCLIDDDQYAFNYNNVNIKRPIIGTGLIIDSIPVLEPMVLDSKGDWVR